MVKHGPEVLAIRRTLRELDLVTVCEDAGCPNLSECWADGTATFMVLGDRCTRACGFCLVDTRKPMAPDAGEPSRVAEAVDRMGLDHAVLTMVARDDLDDGGMAHVAACVEAIRLRRPSTRVETLISDVKGDPASLEVLFAVRPDVFNHNIETVARLQRAVRPSAGYARSLSVLAHAKAAGLVTKSSLIVGMGETDAEVIGCLADLAGIGVDIVTIGQYLRPTTHHLPVARWVEPSEFVRWKEIGEQLGIGHVEAGPLTRSSYHAKAAAEHTTELALRPRRLISCSCHRIRRATPVAVTQTVGGCMDRGGSGVNNAMVTEGAVARDAKNDPANDVGNDAANDVELEIEASSESPVTFTELYAREFQPLVRLATLMTGRVEIARDVVQEAFVKLHVKWPGVRDPAAYVRRSVVNGCRSHHRWERRRRGRPRRRRTVGRPRRRPHTGGARSVAAQATRRARDEVLRGADRA